MKLLIINGSPRGKGSNTKILTDAFTEGFKINNSNIIEKFFLYKKYSEDDARKSVKNSEYIFLAFPLYTDCMPGIVKEFLEIVEKSDIDLSNIKLFFLVQSGFPESHHSIFVERYLEKFARKMKAEYLGTIIKGGVEGIKIIPAWMTKKTLGSFRKLGEKFGISGKLDQKILKKLASPAKMGKPRLIFYSIGKALNMTNFYWNYQLKENKAFEKRFARPYE
jgi:NAD(P)H-dependent FMN reductase